MEATEKVKPSSNEDAAGNRSGKIIAVLCIAAPAACSSAPLAWILPQLSSLKLWAAE